MNIFLPFLIYGNMMNYIFALSLIISLLTAVLSGNTEALGAGLLKGASDAVSLAVKLLAALSLWNGISEIMLRSGLHKKIERLLSPFMKLIFPTLHRTPAGEMISMNITANLLGLGNAATPFGIEAMKRIRRHTGSDAADSETVRFVVINSAALTLIPATVAALRAAAGSTAPFSILLPVWCSGLCALTAGLISEKILSGLMKK